MSKVKKRRASEALTQNPEVVKDLMSLFKKHGITSIKVNKAELALADDEVKEEKEKKVVNTLESVRRGKTSRKAKGANESIKRRKRSRFGK